METNQKIISKGVLSEILHINTQKKFFWREIKIKTFFFKNIFLFCSCLIQYMLLKTTKEMKNKCYVKEECFCFFLGEKKHPNNKFASTLWTMTLITRNIHSVTHLNSIFIFSFCNNRELEFWICQNKKWKLKLLTENAQNDTREKGVSGRRT